MQLSTTIGHGALDARAIASPDPSVANALSHRVERQLRTHVSPA